MFNPSHWPWKSNTVHWDVYTVLCKGAKSLSPLGFPAQVDSAARWLIKVWQGLNCTGFKWTIFIKATYKRNLKIPKHLLPFPLLLTNNPGASQLEHWAVQRSALAIISSYCSSCFVGRREESLSHWEEICWTWGNKQSCFSQLIAAAPWPAWHTLPAATFPNCCAHIRRWPGEQTKTASAT